MRAAHYRRARDGRTFCAGCNRVIVNREIVYPDGRRGNPAEMFRNGQIDCPRCAHCQCGQFYHRKGEVCSHCGAVIGE